MVWRIEFERDAIRQLNRLDKGVRQRILEYLESRVVGVGGPRRFGKPLTRDRAGFWAYRIGAYRVVCLLEDQRLVVVAVSYQSGIGAKSIAEAQRNVGREWRSSSDDLLSYREADRREQRMSFLAATPFAHRRRAQAHGPGAVLLALLALALTGCASGPKPVLYPNDQLQAVGQAEADRAIAECRELAESAGASGGSGDVGRAAGSTAAGGAIGGATGAVGGAILGRPGTGAAVGAATGATAGLLRSIFSGGGRQPGPAYRNFVDRCLRERGYEPVGWE